MENLIPQPNYKIITYGCKVNTYDSGLLEKNLQNWGINRAGWSDRRVYILNTCAVTAEATKEAVRRIRRLKSKEPLCTVVVTGCSAQVDTGIYEKLPGADLIVANSHKTFLPEIIDQYFKGEIKEKVFKSNIFRKEDLEAGGGEESHHTRAFLKIQDGCNSFCSYCIIPYARGKSRSIPADVLVHRIQDLETAGFKEVVLTGVHIGDYAEGEVDQVEKLIEVVLKKTKIPRIRLTSFEPPELTDKLLDLFSDKRLCPHFHMSIQSAEDQVLKDMKRQYTADAVRETLFKIEKRIPQAFVGMDVIVGFPTETEERFEKTLKLLDQTPWTRLHVFPYSERNGTKAAQMTEYVEPKERQKRSEVLRDLSMVRWQEMAAKQLGQNKKILILKKQEGLIHGLSRDYWPVVIPESSFPLEQGAEYSVKIQGWERPSVTNFDVRLRGDIA